ncbi:MAG: S8 family serine peptidase [Patescibacteria group bacterium]
MESLQIYFKITVFVTMLSLAIFGTSSAFAAENSGLIPNDPYYGQEWGMDYIKAPEAWETGQNQIVTSTREVVVAVIDAGMDVTHPDIREAIWTNTDEIPLNNIDDDDDGLVGDVHGWNFTNDSPDVKPMDSMMYLNGAWEHGTAVASLIAGRGNNGIGMSGLAWNAKIMPLVILGADGSGSTDNLAQAIRYAVVHRADIINLSLEGDASDENVKTAITEATAQGVLVVVAAGNGMTGVGYDLDAEPVYPSCYQGAADQGMLSVGALAKNGARSMSSNHGGCVSLSAPGENIFAAQPTFDPDGNQLGINAYGEWSGTSLAAPLVSGVAAMLKAQHPDWNGEQLANRILDSVQPFNRYVNTNGMGKGVLDAFSALAPASAVKYGPWKLLAANPGSAPMIWIDDENDNELYSFPVGNLGDKRGLRAIFVHWDEDRYPDVLATTQGDETGAWRVYRSDGVLLAAGQADQNGTNLVKGGLLLASQDLNASGREQVLLTEANGARAWRLSPETGLGQSFFTTDAVTPLGTLAVGIERPQQAILLLSRSLPSSSLTVLRDVGLGEGSDVTTTKPANINVMSGLTQDNREVVSMVQSGTPTYLIEQNGVMDVTHGTLEVSVWHQAPLGMPVAGRTDRKFYDFWPR